ncbi:hypothetical protein [Candidatus Mycoplasma haematominutum]|uniref:Signal recognition particle protein n=1 Tax=Candidatus Mycoplasma haematominutum 'Birmingham 1' TaxID=1116213 RepID=G8C2I4_9MOLU|nr:hypothetical protein [Candidatus Mycoplasma haematominutum]CCE66532.1 signal recognition particle protein [Candidatus Mycoplasma haematominutum 'Birmingham 1']
MILLDKIIQKILASKIKHNFLAKMIGEKEMELIFSELKYEFVQSDVNFEVATKFFQDIRNEIKSENKIFMGKEEVQLEIYQKIKDKLIESLGVQAQPLKLKSNGRTKLLLVGVNGVGKTTTLGKLSYYLQNKKGIKTIEAVSLDSNRAAAFPQLQQLVAPLKISSYFVPLIEGEGGLLSFEESYKNKNIEVTLYDSGGILPKDEESLRHLRKIWEIIKPTETIMVLDALAGQEALEMVRLFHDSITLDSLIVTKSDSMSPLGAALSAHYFFGLPIKFLGEGEHLTDLVIFHPDRIVSRLLGEGDVEGLAEKIKESAVATNLCSVENSIFKFLKGQFDLEDLIVQMREIKKVGSFGNLAKFFPNLGIFSQTLINKSDELEEEFRKWEILIQSMTSAERRNPKLFKKESSRRSRVIKGSGRKPEELNRLLSRWEITKKKAEEIGHKVLQGGGDWMQIFNHLK